MRPERWLPPVFVLLSSACGPQAPPPEPAVVGPPEPTASAAAAPGASAPGAAHALAAGNLAFREARLYAPAGGNALEFFLGARDAEPGNLAATEALVELFPLALAGAEAAIANAGWAEADRVLGLLDRAQPDSLAVRRLRERLQTQRALAERALAERALAEAERARIAAASGGAAAQGSGPGPATAPAAPAPVVGGGRDQAATAPIRAAELGRDAAAIAPAVAAAPPAADAADRPASVPAPSASAEPRAAMAAAAAPPAPPRETEPRVLERVNPEYPAIARTRRIEGYVELEFTVTVDGRADAIRVVAAEPGGVFDAAATRALMRWRFAPGTRDGQPQLMRTRARIGFRLG